MHFVLDTVFFCIFLLSSFGSLDNRRPFNSNNSQSSIKIHITVSIAWGKGLQPSQWVGHNAIDSLNSPFCSAWTWRVRLHATRYRSSHDATRCGQLATSLLRCLRPGPHTTEDGQTDCSRCPGFLKFGQSLAALKARKGSTVGVEIDYTDEARFCGKL